MKKTNSGLRDKLQGLIHTDLIDDTITENVEALDLDDSIENYEGQLRLVMNNFEVFKHLSDQQK